MFSLSVDFAFARLDLGLEVALFLLVGFGTRLCALVIEDALDVFESFVTCVSAPTDALELFRDFFE